MKNPDNRVEIQYVAVLEEHGQLKDVMGIPVEVADEKLQRGKDRFALTRSGLIRITREGLSWAHGIEGTHIDNVAVVSSKWREIKKLTGFTKDLVNSTFDEFEKSKIKKEASRGNQTSSMSKAKWEHADMMDRAGDLR